MQTKAEQDIEPYDSIVVHTKAVNNSLSKLILNNSKSETSIE